VPWEGHLVRLTVEPGSGAIPPPAPEEAVAQAVARRLESSPALAGAIRLVKAWAASEEGGALSSALSGLALDALVVGACSGVPGGGLPATAQRGFAAAMEALARLSAGGTLAVAARVPVGQSPEAGAAKRLGVVPGMLPVVRRAAAEVLARMRGAFGWGPGAGIAAGAPSRGMPQAQAYEWVCELHGTAAGEGVPTVGCKRARAHVSALPESLGASKRRSAQRRLVAGADLVESAVGGLWARFGHVAFFGRVVGEGGGEGVAFGFWGTGAAEREGSVPATDVMAGVLHGLHGLVQSVRPFGASA